MNLNRFISLILISTALLQACSSSKKMANKPLTINLDTLTVKEKDPVKPIYRASATRINDLIHTKLEVSFDWNKKYLFGKATLTLKPYFYPTNVLDLDARGMEIKEVTLLKEGSRKELNYTYKNNVIHIDLDKVYPNSEEYQIFIDYIAKPEELEKGGSAAITDDKGLYFINPDGKDKDKPQQIWTQGETESNSAWMPTIDKPNERMTQEIFITTEDKYITLSNGELISIFNNGDGTHTDYWKMELPHAPYLAMMTIGDFAVVKDKWRDKEVNYYIEKKYEPYAKTIFGNTPEMMEFFSKKLGVDYAWNKYSQIVVRDYVSGAMENTTATLHGEFMNRTDRELLYEDYEDVISHELFHQWFGDLVTTESWSNLPLNESFATYGEYLWNEYKYGKETADQASQQSRNIYLREALQKQEPLIRFHYDNREDMFDRHSYNKGGQVLHMLRTYVGDDAFFAALKLYLETNKFKSVEIHNLRLAFEQVTGEDLNWFFNQWFLSPGHPEITIRTSYDEVTKKEKVEITQTQNLEKTPVFEIPMYIDIYSGGAVERKKIRVENSSQKFYFDVAKKPDLVNVDAEKMLLCKKTDIKTVNEWAFQYAHAPLYLDRAEALSAMAAKRLDTASTNDEKLLAAKTIIAALDDKFWGLRLKAAYMLKLCLVGNEQEIKNKLIKLSTDDKALIREAAIDFLAANYKDEDLITIYQTALKDKTYEVIGSGLIGLKKMDPKAAMASARELENEKNRSLYAAIMSVYADFGSAENNNFFIKASEEFKVYYLKQFVMPYGAFLKRVTDYETLDKGLDFLVSYVNENTYNPYGKNYLKKILTDLQAEMDKRMKAGNDPRAEQEKQKILELYNSLK